MQSSKKENNNQKFFVPLKGKDKNNGVQYVSYHKLFPAQARYSEQNALEKVDRVIEAQAAIFNEEKNLWKFKHHGGTSVLSKKKAIPVVKTSFGYVLTDGHHDVIASIKLNAEMIPIKVIKDLSHLSVEKFWREAENQGWSYLYNTKGEKTSPPVNFSELVDDPNRYFAAITARKYTKNDDGSYSSKGAQYPLWIKIDKDIPFIEFKIANILYAKGFVYNIDKFKNAPTQDIEEQARKILLDANIPGLNIVRSRTPYGQIHLNQNGLDVASDTQTLQQAFSGLAYSKR